MSQISLEGISKLYRVIGPEQRSRDLTTRVGRVLLSPIRKLRELRSLDRFNGAAEPNVLWALKNVSFSVEPGEVIGIIGRNGAGKSTLLKILSRITRPTYGRATLRGRVSSLLEVGTGFHPELSGRENIFLNGAIIGMRAQEIRRKLDAIVDYSGVEKFLDTPIKRYSSGMKVRLAFAVAAHLEPDILVIDEVLAVGDTEFQQKCLGTMSEFGRHGRTVLFVSHNLAAVQSLCKRGLVLRRGELYEDTTATQAVDAYLRSIREESSGSNYASAQQSNGFILNHLGISGSAEEACPLRCGGPMSIDVSIAGAGVDTPVILLVWFSGQFGERVLLLSSRLAGLTIRPFRRSLVCRISVSSLMLMPGHYHANVALLTASTESLARWEQIQSVEVHAGAAAFSHSLPSPSARGVVYAPSEWSVESDTE